MRRILERNGDLLGEMRVAVPTSEQYSVFRSYLDARHRDGGMADMSVLDYALMVEDSHVETRMVEYRRRGPDSAINGRGTGELIAVALTDVLADGLSMVYSFFESEQAPRSLGTFMILDHIARARRMGLAYVYLGYWVGLAQDGLQGASCRSNGCRRRLEEGPPPARMTQPGLIVRHSRLAADPTSTGRVAPPDRLRGRRLRAPPWCRCGVETQECTYLSLDEQRR